MKVNSSSKSYPPLVSTPTQRIARLLLATSFVIASFLQLSAQNAVLAGTIAGRVTDPGGASVPVASLVLRNLATGLQQTTVTNHAGLYQFLALMPAYDLNLHPLQGTTTYIVCPPGSAAPPCIGEELEFQFQAFNLFNHPNDYVQNGDGVNQLQYNPSGSNCGDGNSLNQTCYLIPNSGPGNFGALQEISPNGLPRVLQLSARFTFQGDES